MSRPRQYSLLPCPRCGAPSTVAYARATVRGTFRRRRCTGCGMTFGTEERIVGAAGAQDRPIPGHILRKALADAGLAVDWDAPDPV